MPVGKIEIEWEKLEDIAHYYEFPSAVFLMPKEQWKKNREIDSTRLKSLVRDSEILEKIIEVIESAKGTSSDSEEGEQ